MKSDTKKSVRIEEEPKASQTAAPVFIFVVFALLLYWGALHIDKFGGGFERHVYAPYTSTNQLPKVGAATLADKGRTLYMANCAPCHQANGNGLAGQNPPLGGSEWVLAAHPARIIRIVLDGASGPMEVKGAQYNSVMIPWRDIMSDEDVAAVLTYIRGEWGNKADAVAPELVKEIRGETAGRSGPWTQPELLQVPDKK